VQQPAEKGRSVGQTLSSPALRTHSFGAPWLSQIFLALALLALAVPAFGTKVKREAWGKNSSGQAMDRYTLSSGDAEYAWSPLALESYPFASLIETESWPT
jgi:hypothetical protein